MAIQDVGRFVTEDPARNRNNWYAYCENDPINFLDPNGKDIISLEPVNSASFLEQINKLSAVQFAFTKDSKLAIDPSSGINTKGSFAYSTKLVEAIQAVDRIFLVKTEILGFKGQPPIDVRGEGGGVTTNYPGTKDIGVAITGQQGQMTTQGGQNIKASAAEVLMHELTTHAIPALLAGQPPKTFTSLKQENVIRAEMNLPLRAPDATHTK
jgi:hypothetical protein